MVTKDNLVGILAGGPSREANVSRSTGHAVYNALKTLGYRVVLMEYDPPKLAGQLKEYGVDAVFLALHGKYGEDGTVQGMLELLEIPYTGSGVLSSAITMDKIMSSRLFKAAGIRMAKSHSYFYQIGISNIMRDIEQRFSYPFVLKPAREGSTIGIEIVSEKEELEPALHRVFKLESRILVEDYLGGSEFTVTVLNGNALPVIEICPHSNAYDYYSKYTKGATDYLVPAPISEELSAEMSQMAISGYQMAECSGVARFDFRTDANGVPYLLEANSIPGMTETSLVPKAAWAVGMDFPRLCETLLQEASIGKV